MTIQSNRPACTPEHKRTWNYSYTTTLPPILTLLAACTKLQTTFSIGLEPQQPGFQKTKNKSVEARVRTKGGGGGGLSSRDRGVGVGISAHRGGGVHMLVLGGGGADSKCLMPTRDSIHTFLSVGALFALAGARTQL